MSWLLYFLVFGELVMEWAAVFTVWFAVFTGPSVYYDVGVTGPASAITGLVGFAALVYVAVWIGHRYRLFGIAEEMETNEGMIARIGAGEASRYFAKVFFGHMPGLILWWILYNEVAAKSVQPDANTDTGNFVRAVGLSVMAIVVVIDLTFCFITMHQAWFSAMLSQKLTMHVGKACGFRSMKLTTTKKKKDVRSPF